MTSSIDILMITYNRPDYTRLSLARLLDEADERSRIWVWHNGNDQDTIDVVRNFEGNPRLHFVHHSPENLRLREPSNWFWTNATGDLIGKVDDDCLVPAGWVETLRAAHELNQTLGVASAWPFRPEDHDAPTAQRKVIALSGGHRLMRNPWTGGSGYIMKRACIETNGPLRHDESFTQWCIRLSRRGWINGWYYPLVYMDHMDDPRSPNTALRSDDDFTRRPPLNAINHSVMSLDEARRRAVVHARYLQSCPSSAWWYVGAGNVLRKTVARARRLISRQPVWTG